MTDEDKRLRRNAAASAHYYRNKKQINDQRRLYRHAQIARDPEAFRARMRAYYAANREKRCERTREDRKKNPEHYRAYDKLRNSKDPKRARKNNLKRKFGITIEQYEAMLTAQDGHCATCPTGEKINKLGQTVSLAIDHCHKTGVIRGLLCGNCNVSIGMVNDNIDRLKALIAYIEKYNTICII